MSGEDHIWAVVPAAGRSHRLGSDKPKQYLPLHGRTVLGWVLARLAGCAAVEGIVVALAADDHYWRDLAPAKGLGKPVAVVVGGAERQDSVVAGLMALADRAAPEDWVLVHDAARPCLHRDDLDKLVATLRDEVGGGLLAVPVSDTLKRADSSGHVVTTVPRDDVWRALTPQMFRYGKLREALEDAVAAGITLTDEAAVMERAGYPPRLVEGRADNIKITYRNDLVLAAQILAAQEEER